jgi:F0F1-type ATP synthase membrane subunit b/b'
VSTELLATLVANFGAVGIIMWLVYRTTTKTIPDMVAVHQVSLEQARDDFKAMLAQQREDFHRELEREREVHDQQVAAIVSTLEDVKNRMPTTKQIFEMIDRARGILD